jgi:hypothetical protein
MGLSASLSGTSMLDHHIYFSISNLFGMHRNSLLPLPHPFEGWAKLGLSQDRFRVCYYWML